jgi:hypothetical protein
VQSIPSALAALRAYTIRSVLTTLGIIIGVAAVITIVARPRRQSGHEPEELEDLSLGQEVSGVIRGLEIGVFAGAAVGVGVAAYLGVEGAAGIAGLAGAGALAGSVVGSIDGAAAAARYDDDAAQSLELRPGTTAVLLKIGSALIG